MASRTAWPPPSPDWPPPTTSSLAGHVRDRGRRQPSEHEAGSGRGRPFWARSTTPSPCRWTATSRRDRRRRRQDRRRRPAAARRGRRARPRGPHPAAYCRRGTARRARRRRRPRRATPRGGRLGADVEEHNAALVGPARRACGPSGETGSAPPMRWATSPVATPAARRSAAFTAVQIGAVGDRSAGGARPGLGRAAPVRVGPRSRPRATGRSRRWSTPRSARPAVHVGLGARQPAASCRSSTRRRPRSASSATTPPRCATRDPRRRAAAPARWRPRRRGSSVLGHTRWASVGIISRAERPSPQPGGGRRRRRRRPRTSWPRSTATSTTTPTSRPRHGLRIPAPITTDAKVIPRAGVARHRAGRRRSPRRSAAPSPHSRAPSPSAPPAGAEPEHDAAGAAGQRPGALRRSRRRTPSSWPASRTGSSRRPARYLRMDGETPAARRAGEPGPGRRARRRRAPASSRASRGAIRRHRAAGRPTSELRHAEDHHARHRPRRRAALPAQGDHRGAGQLPQDAAGAHRRATTVMLRADVGERALPAAVVGPPGGRHDRSRRDHRPGHGGDRRPEHGRSAGRLLVGSRVVRATR